MPPPLSTAASACVPERIASANRLPIAASRVRTVAVEESSATVVTQSGSLILSISAASKRATAAATSGSGVTSPESITRKFGRQVVTRLPPSSRTEIVTSTQVT